MRVARTHHNIKFDLVNYLVIQDCCGLQAVGFDGDVRKQEDAARVLAATVEHFGKLDILVNGAAGNFLASPEDLKPKGFRTGTFIISRLNLMIPNLRTLPSIGWILLVLPNCASLLPQKLMLLFTVLHAYHSIVSDKLVLTNFLLQFLTSTLLVHTQCVMKP
jgi:NAD(P)-dependent dehydrogenase (short-subunit alcohol dehydrogenase family)